MPSRQADAGWPDLREMLAVPFRPFSAACGRATEPQQRRRRAPRRCIALGCRSRYWLALLALLLFLGGALWAIEGWTNEEDFPFKAAGRGLFDGCFRIVQSFFGCNDHRVSPFSVWGRLLALP